MKLNKKIKRMFHHYEKWEEYKFGMWRNISLDERAIFIKRTAELMRDSQKFKSAMRRVIIEWPYSREANLTSAATNRQAWLGHAGCCLLTSSPEDTTRLGWHTLNQKEQDEAKGVADEVIAEWEILHLEKLRLVAGA